MSLAEQVTQAQVKNALAKAKAGKVLTRREEQLIRDFEANRAPELTLEQVAEHFGVSRPAALKWKRTMLKAGLPWNSLEQIAEWKEQHAKKVKPDDINSARKAKLEREVERLDIKIKREKGELVLKDEVREAVQKVIAILCSEGVAMCGDLPGQLEGLDAANMRPKITARWELMLSNAKERFSEI